MGDRFGGSIEQATRMLQEAPVGGDRREVASEIVAGYRARKEIIPGLGHPIHKAADPRTIRLFALAEENGFHGPHVRLIELIAQKATAVYGRDLPVNATVTLSPSFSVERFQPAWTRLFGLFISMAQLSSLPAPFGTSTRNEACGLVQVNSVTVPEIIVCFSRSNMAPEW